MPQQPTLDFGTDPHKLHRRDAPETSVAAAHRVNTVTDESRVYGIIHDSGDYGATLREISDRLCKQMNQVSGRVTSLLAKKIIKTTGRQRKRCRVYVVTG
ncbi:MAG: hypothetical protein KDA32_10885 [Phycisphaerales bacterium]|nr:hypothetical protein [Phycisphaerales bacterium]